MRSQMKSKMFVLAAAIAALTVGGVAAAQDYRFGWNPRSGDVWVDNQLDDVNRYGSRYREPFVDEMARYYGAPRDLVTDLLVNRNWAPGDVYYACSLAQVLGRPCRYVVNEWERDHGQGWGELAKRLGIKPGSPEFHRLKRGFVPTYDRWARPIRIDDDLVRDFPDRGKGQRMRSDGPGDGKRGVSAAGKSGKDARESNDKGNDKGSDKSKGKGKDKDKDKGGGKG